jgi:hypothetical protein
VSRRAWLRAGIGVAGGLAVAGAATWFFVFRDVAEPATVGEAVTSFREHPGSGSPVAPGVYVYETRGLEKTDALTGVTHRYPSRSTLTVTGDPCGFRIRWSVLKGRSTEWSFCVDESSWKLLSQDERHTFFGRTEHTDYSCPDLAFWSTAASSTYICATGNASERGVRRISAGPRVRVGGRVVGTTLVRRTSIFSGAIRGTSRYDFVLDRRSGIPLRIAMESKTTNDSPVGAVHYEERVVLRLTSLTPRR